MDVGTSTVAVIPRCKVVLRVLRDEPLAPPIPVAAGAILCPDVGDLAGVEVWDVGGDNPDECAQPIFAQRFGCHSKR